jgi:hypothetical protein
LAYTHLSFNAYVLSAQDPSQKEDILTNRISRAFLRGSFGPSLNKLVQFCDEGYGRWAESASHFPGSREQGFWAAKPAEATAPAADGLGGPQFAKCYYLISV